MNIIRSQDINSFFDDVSLIVSLKAVMSVITMAITAAEAEMKVILTAWAEITCHDNIYLRCHPW